MDSLENVLKFEVNQFPIETDSYLASNYVHEFKIQEDQEQIHLNSQNKFQKFFLNDIVEELKSSNEFVDIPIYDLLHSVKEKYELGSHSEEEIFNVLKKTKLIMKRQRAKSRKRNRKTYVSFQKDSPASSLNINVVITQQEQKRKKNRISAQISRDKKKQYFNNLIKQNQVLKKQKNKLQKDNSDLKTKLGESLIEVIMNMNRNFFKNLPKLSKFKGKKLQSLKTNIKKIQAYAK